MKSCFAMRPAMCRKPSKPKWFCHSFASVPASLFPALFVQTESIVIVTMRLLVAILVALVACAVAQCPTGTCPSTNSCSAFEFSTPSKQEMSSKFENQCYNTFI